MKIIKWQNIVQLRLYYVHESKWTWHALKELYDSKEKAEQNFIKSPELKYIGAVKLEFDLPDE